MFGYILVNPKTLSKDEKARYREAYCGMCKQLQAYGAEGRTVLSYDMTFIAMLLNSVYLLDENHGVERCVMRPAPAHGYFLSDATAYAADMNVLFAYYKALDDWNDDRDRRALARSEKLAKFIPEIKRKWPVQANRAAECIGRLSDMERRNVLNPDEPANCFGILMGEILDWRGETPTANMDESAAAVSDMAVSAVDVSTVDLSAVDVPAVDVPAVDLSTVDVPADTASANIAPAETSPTGAGLRRMGEALGRFLYLLDASNDLRDDIRKERYNPLVAQTDTDFEPLLTMLIGECTREFEALGAERDLHLLKNVLYSGIWMKYRKKRRGDEHVAGYPTTAGSPATPGTSSTTDNDTGGKGDNP